MMHCRNERGMALAVAIFALVLIGALVAMAFFSGRLEQRGGAGSVYAVQAFEAAEAGMVDVIARWDATAFDSLAPGSSLPLDEASLDGGEWYRPTVTRLNETLFLVRAEGTRRGPSGQFLARRVLGTLVRLETPGVAPAAALTAAGAVTLSQSATVDGRDGVPPGWEALCDSLGAGTAGIRVPPAALVSGGSGCESLGCVAGAPAVARDTLVSAASIELLGSATFDELAARADFRVGGTIGSAGPRATGSMPARCVTADSLNWGEPWVGGGVAACAGYFPVIYAPADLRLTGGRGQGVLLVTGNLELSGGAEFNGPVVVLGAMRSVGSGGTLRGGLLVAGAAVDLAGYSRVVTSSCAVRRARSGAARARPLDERSWLQLY